MGVQWKNQKLSVSFLEVDHKIEDARNTVIEVADDLLEQASATGKNIIETTPSGINPDKPDRVWTGNMRDSVGFQPLSGSGKRWQGRAGWVDSVDDYFKVQEHGGTAHLMKGTRTVSPMHMLIGMRTQLEQDLHERLVAEFGA